MTRIQDTDKSAEKTGSKRENGLKYPVHLQYAVSRDCKDDRRHGDNGDGGGNRDSGKRTFLQRTGTNHRRICAFRCEEKESKGN